MLFAVKVVLNCGFNEVLFESDCLGVINHLKRGVSNLSSF